MNRWTVDAGNAAVGGIIETVTLDTDRGALRLRLADGRTFVGWAEGDCCSQSWIEHLTVPPDIAGAEITGMPSDYVDGTDVDETTCVNHGDIFLDRVQAYQDSIRTTRGEIVIEYRNSSNGYYGGSIEWSVDDAPAQ